MFSPANASVAMQGMFRDVTNVDGPPTNHIGTRGTSPSSNAMVFQHLVARRTWDFPTSIDEQDCP